MASDHLNTNKVNFLIEDEEWELLKMFENELLAFREAIEVFYKSKSITSSNVFGFYGLLVQRLDSLMSSDQAKALRRTYMVMKEKCLKYDIHVKRKLMFLIATVPRPYI